ncbi:MAG: hypothetical protein V3T66_06600 [Alphaproteobacteria bacterium]
MFIVYSHSQVPIRLTIERWKHIVTNHPEMDTQKERVLETVAEPDLIQEGDYGELLAARFYEETPLTSKHLVVAYRETDTEDGFVVTAYLTRRPSTQRTLLWKR